MDSLKESVKGSTVATNLMTWCGTQIEGCKRKASQRLSELETIRRGGGDKEHRYFSLDHIDQNNWPGGPKIEGRKGKN